MSPVRYQPSREGRGGLGVGKVAGHRRFRAHLDLAGGVDADLDARDRVAPTVSRRGWSSGQQAMTGTSLVPYAEIQPTPVRRVTSSATLAVTGVAHHMM